MATGDAKIKATIEWDESTRTLIDALKAVVVIGPDDHLVLVYRHISRLQADELKVELRERYPALADRVVIVADDLELAAVRAAGGVDLTGVLLSPGQVTTSDGVPLTGELVEQLNLRCREEHD